jgi:hypothetical protein
MAMLNANIRDTVSPGAQVPQNVLAFKNQADTTSQIRTGFTGLANSEAESKLAASSIKTEFQ